MKLTTSETSRNAPPTTYAYPLARAAFSASVNVKVAGEALARGLDRLLPRAAKYAPPRGFKYRAPPEDGLWNVHGCWEARARAIRNRRDECTLEAHRAWATRLDYYHYLRSDLSAAINAARASIDAARIELDDPDEPASRRCTILLRESLRHLKTATDRLGDKPWTLTRAESGAPQTLMAHLREFEARWDSLRFRDMATQPDTQLTAPSPGTEFATPATERPAVIETLFQALHHVDIASSNFMYCHAEAVDLHQRIGAPGAGDWPSQAAARRNMNAALLDGARREASARGENDAAIFVVDRPWVRRLKDLVEAYREWDQAIDAAVAAVPATTSIMDAGEPRIAERWTTKTLAELRQLRGLVQFTVQGREGLGIGIYGCVALSPKFAKLVLSLRERRLILTDVRGAVRVIDGEETRGGFPPTAAKRSKRRRSRRQSARKLRPLSPKQTEAMHIVGECKGNIAEAARRLDRDRKTIQQHYEAACKKLGIRGRTDASTRRLAMDLRGQEAPVVDRHNENAASSTRTEPLRDRRHL